MVGSVRFVSVTDFMDCADRVNYAVTGSYDMYGLCMPTLPFGIPGRGSRKVRPTPFYGLEDDLPILVAMICGFQHSLAMLVRGVCLSLQFAWLKIVKGWSYYVSDETRRLLQLHEAQWLRQPAYHIFFCSVAASGLSELHGRIQLDLLRNP
jgi:hypothetical protein